MAPNKKKKKAASNPARGFATVSQPSKTKDTPNLLDEAENAQDLTSDSKEATNQAHPIVVPYDDPPSDLKEMSPDELEAHLEDAEMQNIIDSNSVRCKQDAARQVARLEVSRRQLRSQSHRLSTNWLSDEVIDKILQKGSEQRLDSFKIQFCGLIDDTDLLLKVWTLRTVLIRLKFTKIDPVIKHVLLLTSRNKLATSIDYIWGLQEALEWYAADSQQQDLPDYETGMVANLASTSDTANDLDLGTAFNTSQTEPTPDITIPSEDVPSNHKEEHEDDKSLPALSATDSEDDDPASLTNEYLKLQILAFYTEQRISVVGRKSSRLEQRKIRLDKRIDKIRRDILFDADTADAMWNENLRELRIDMSMSARPKKPTAKSTATEQELKDYAEDNGDMLGDIFGTNDNDLHMLADPTEQSTVRVVDFGKWTGTHPRRLMEESCRSLDGHCTVKFNTLTATSFSVRQRVELRWSVDCIIDEDALSAMSEELTRICVPRVLVLEMRAIATPSPAQAESYLSTIVLFLLVHSGYVDQKQINRLPTAWRDVYYDLGRARQVLVDKADKETLSVLRRIIHNTQESIKNIDKALIHSEHKTSTIPDLRRRDVKEHARFSAEEASMQWASRISSPAYQAILPTRQQLPVHQYKDIILQAVHDNKLVIVCADTGAGKSTQVPSFVLEHELSCGRDCRVLVTQPRRISAISLARRVSQELGEHRNDLGTDRSLVGYAIRLESKTSKTTRITFATTGVLLRMIEASPQLDDLDYLILDEIHERTMDIDLLFIALKRLQQRRAELRIVLMSATLDAQKFSNYFDGAPVLDIPGRTYPVEIRYLEDAIEDSQDIKVHGHDTNGYDNDSDESDDVEKSKTDLLGLEHYSSRTRSRLAQMDEHRIDYDLTTSLAEAIATKEKYVKYSSAILIFMPGIAEIRRLHNTLISRTTFSSKWIIHLLHSSFSTEDLERAFSKPPHGNRKIVIATNIAETGITIPDVTAVIDTCKEKIMRFDERRQLSKLTESFISRSSARQRRGRAARVQEGLCFHLVTRYRFENLMLEQHVPEILRLSLQDPILRIKIWNLGSIEETLAAAIDPPTGKNVRRAVDKLKDAGALSTSEELTHLGKIIARLPLEVVLSKLAVFGIVFKCLDAVLTIIAALSSKSPFLIDKGGFQTDPRLAFAKGDSDLISTLNAYQAWRKAKQAGLAHQFCKKHRLHDQNLSSMEDQKVQLMVYLVDAGLVQLDQEEQAALSRSRSSGNRKTFFSIPDRFNIYDNETMINCVIAMAFYPKILVREGKGWRNVYTNQRVNLTSNSVIRTMDKPPKWLCFYEAMQTRSGSLNVLEISKVPEMLIVTLLGSAEFVFFSGVIGLDNGRMRFSLRQWRHLAAIKTLRDSLAAVLDRCWQSPGLWVPPPSQDWMDLFAGIVAGKETKSQ